MKLNQTAGYISIGPFLDVSDAATLETGLAGTMTVYLSKNNGAYAARNSATAISYDRGGHYRVHLDATDRNTTGPLLVNVSDPATHLDVTREYEVLTNTAYTNWLAGITDANITKVTGTSVSSVSDFKATGFSTFSSTADTVILAAQTHTGAVIPVVTSCSGANVTDISTATLAKFASVDTGEGTAATGSVAYLGQGSASAGAVTVGSMSTAALAQFATVDTGASSGVSGSVVSLANGGVALTSGVVTTACETALTNYGYTIALSGTLANLSSTVGSGAISKVVTVTDAVSSPIQGAEVWISTDTAGTNIVAGILTTNAQGQVTFWADAGTYYAWIDAPNYNESNPYTITVP